MSPLVVWVLVASLENHAHPRVDAYATEAACKAEADRVLLVAAQAVNNGNKDWPIPHVRCDKKTVQN